jgi:hypothetical protein
MTCLDVEGSTYCESPGPHEEISDPPKFLGAHVAPRFPKTSICLLRCQGTRTSEDQL